MDILLQYLSGLSSVICIFMMNFPRLKLNSETRVKHCNLYIKKPFVKYTEKNDVGFTWKLFSFRNV